MVMRLMQICQQKRNWYLRDSLISIKVSK
jgi:hypothetical protein